MTPFAPGQVWTYNNRPGEDASRVIICRVEDDPKLGVIVHIHLNGLQLKSAQAPSRHSDQIGHMPFLADALRQSVKRLESTTTQLPEFEAGYQQWRTGFDKAEAGVWSTPLSEAITNMEAAINSAKRDDMESAKAECEELLNDALPFAEAMLIKYREFFPFGRTMAGDGTISHTVGWTGEEQPPSTELIEILMRVFRDGAMRQRYKATALIYDVYTTPPQKTAKQDAIAVALDHQSGYSVIVYYPYAFGASGELMFEEPFVSQGESQIFL